MAPLNTIRPALKDLVCYAVPRIAAVWYDVGLQLDLEPDVLDEIEKEKSDQPRRMFAKWLQGSSCSWQSVLDAVEKTRGAKPMEDIHADVVESIRKAQSTGQHAHSNSGVIGNECHTHVTICIGPAIRVACGSLLLQGSDCNACIHF